jgi:hypothetical protein
MTDVMPEQQQPVDLDELSGGERAGRDGLDARLAGRAREGGLGLTGEGGLLAQLIKRLVESALEGEITDHLGYDRHKAAGRDGGNSRNGHRSKTVLTEVGPVEVDVPRDRDGSFEPKIMAKRQRRLSGIDELVISLSAKGLTTAGRVLLRPVLRRRLPRATANADQGLAEAIAAGDVRTGPAATTRGADEAVHEARFRSADQDRGHPPRPH